MANKRMFSQAITNSGKFLDMPPSSQSLYFHLGMNADDDGYCEYGVVMRMIGSNKDDLNVLRAKEFIHVYNEYVLIILDWNINNQLRSDRYHPSKYLDTLGIPNGYQLSTQYSIEKKRIEKSSIEKNNKYKNIKSLEDVRTMLSEKMGV